MVSLDFANLFIFEGNGSLDKIKRNAPHCGKEADAEQKPGQGETKNARRHQLRHEVIRQRQAEQDYEERYGDAKN